MRTKSIILAVLSIVFIANINAQKLLDGSMNFLRNETQVNIIFDFSQLRLEGKTLETWAAIEGKTWAEYWDKAVSEFTPKFTNKLNDKLFAENSSLLFGEYQNANYQVVMKILDINASRDIHALLIFSKNDSDTLLATVHIYGKAGHFGSMSNLIGDAMKDAGTKFGKFLANQIKKFKAK